MRIVVTTTQGIAGIVEKKTQTINISPFDTTPKSLIDDKGDLLVGLSAGTLGKLSLGTDGNVLLADSAQTEGIKWGPSPSAGGTFECYNTDGVTHALGTVVIVDPSVNYGVKKTTTDGDPRVMAIAVEAVSSASTGDYAQTGLLEVLVQGNVSRGMWLVCSTTSGRARAAGYIKPTVGGIGIAQTEYTGGAAGSVYVLVDIDLYSTAPLMQLSTVSTNTGTTTALTISHVLDPGTDLLVVLTATNTVPSSVTYNGSGMTLVDNVLSSGKCVGIYYMRGGLPSPGTYNVVINQASSVEAMGLAKNFAGSQASPFRAASKTSGTATSASLTPTSSVGDIVVDCLEVFSASWGVTAGQTTDGQRTVSNTMGSSWKAGAAGSTTMSWGGPSAGFSYVTAAIAGS